MTCFCAYMATSNRETVPAEITSPSIRSFTSFVTVYPFNYLQTPTQSFLLGEQNINYLFENGFDSFQGVLAFLLFVVKVWELGAR